MVDLHKYLADLSSTNAREVLYFLSRYFKGSPHLEENGKDIFADVFDKDTPTEAFIREKTVQVISLIEEEIGKRASDFDLDMTDSILERITELEDRLDGSPTNDEIAHASAFLADVKKRQR